MNALTLVALAVSLAQVPQGVSGAEADAVRGGRLFGDTRAVTGRNVGNCVSCHADRKALREMLVNRGARAGDPRLIEVLLRRAIDGAQPGARSAMAQYRGVLTTQDLRDLAAYLAAAARA